MQAISSHGRRQCQMCATFIGLTSYRCTRCKYEICHTCRTYPPKWLPTGNGEMHALDPSKTKMRASDKEESEEDSSKYESEGQKETNTMGQKEPSAPPLEALYEPCAPELGELDEIPLVEPGQMQMKFETRGNETLDGSEGERDIVPKKPSMGLDTMMLSRRFPWRYS